MKQHPAATGKWTWAVLAATIGLTAGLALAQGGNRQGQFEAFQARITGGSGDQGKCTIEVVVDGVAEIEIRGREGRLRTMSGNPSTWRRMDCNQPFPSNPANFKFSGQEGRGRQSLLRDPGNNNGIPVIRIEDPNGGAEGYKFDVTWRGTTGPANGRPGSDGSIFDPGNTNPGNNSGNNFPNGSTNFPGTGGRGDNGPSGWNRNVTFNGDGTGYFRNSRGGNETLRNALVTVDRSGRVRVELSANRQTRYILEGRLLQANANQLTADVSGGGIEGTMQIVLDGRNRVDQLAMNGSGRNSYELRWQAR